MALAIDIMSLASNYVTISDKYHIKTNQTVERASCISNLLIKTVSRVQLPYSYKGAIQQLMQLNDYIYSQNETQNNFYNAKLLYTFALFSSFSYCETLDEIRELTMYNRDLNGMPLTGNFTLISNYTSKQFFIALSHTEKAIVVSWKGSDSQKDFEFASDATLNGINDESFKLFLDTPSSNPKCSTSKDDYELFYFRGFFDSISQKELDLVLFFLKSAQEIEPNYKIVMTGHSLGGVKALINAFYLSKFYANDFDILAVYTFSQPILGSIAFNNLIANCIGVEKIIRVISEDDAVPFVRLADNVNHADDVSVVYAYNHSQSVWLICNGPYNSSCRSDQDCTERTVNYHSWFAGLRIDGQVCKYNSGF